MANVIWEKKVDIKIGESQQAIIERLIELIDEAILNAPNTIRGILGIGIGVPGIVDYKKRQYIDGAEFKMAGCAS